jgi:hypothetical protein
MATSLEKTLKREITIGGRAFIVAISPEELKLTLKGRRKGLELRWEALVNGDAALAVALNASIGRFPAATPTARKQPTRHEKRAGFTTSTKRPERASRAR